MESIPIEEASILLRKHYVELVSILGQCLNELLLHLVSEEVITIEDKNAIKKFGDCPSDRAEYLLDNHVNRPLFGGIAENFVKLLKVMQKIPTCNTLAADLLKALTQSDKSKTITPRGTSESTERHTKMDDEASKNNQSGMAIDGYPVDVVAQVKNLPRPTFQYCTYIHGRV